MARSHTLAYLDAARSALGLKIVLARVARGVASSTDIEAIERTASDLQLLLAGRKARLSSPLLARPEGLSVAISTAMRIYGPDYCGDKLEPLKDELDALLRDLATSHASAQPRAPLKSTANRLSDLFSKMHDLAEENAALSQQKKSHSHIRRAIAAAIDS